MSVGDGSGAIRLGDIAEIVMGQAPPGEDCNREGRGTAFVKAGEFADRRPVVREWTTNPLKRARVGDVLVCVVGATAGKVNESIDCAIGRSVAAVRPATKSLISDYLYHFLQTQVLRLRAKSQGLAQGVITREMLQDICIPLPPVPEQRRIAAILDKADALRAKRRAGPAQLGTLTQSIFLDMFGDPATNPKGWPEVSFGSVCERVTVGIVVRPASYYRPQGVPALRSLNVKPGMIVLDELVFFSEEDNETKLNKTRLRAGDLVLVRSGQPGTAAVVPLHLHGANAIDLLIASPSKNRCDPSFACAFFNSRGGKAIVLASQRGQIQKHLNVGSLTAAIIPLPPIELQREYSRWLTAVSHQAALQTQALAELDRLFSSLQYRAFRAELGSAALCSDRA